MARAAFPQTSVPPAALGQDDYGLVVWEQMSLLADTFLGDEFPGYRPFPIATDEETVAGVAGTAPLRTTGIDDVRSRLGNVEVPAGSADDHARLLAYLDVLGATQATLAAAAEDGDVALTLATLEDLTAVWCAAGADLNAALGAAVADHLGPSATDPRCES
jgi:hypothetical protein